MWNITNQTAAIQTATATATTIQAKTRSRLLMRWPALYLAVPGTHVCELGTGREQVMNRNCNAENHYCSRDNEKGNRANSFPHALSLARRFEAIIRLTYQQPFLSQCRTIQWGSVLGDSPRTKGRSALSQTRQRSTRRCESTCSPAYHPRVRAGVKAA